MGASVNIKGTPHSPGIPSSTNMADLAAPSLAIERKAQRRRHWAAAIAILPVLLFLAVFFVGPLALNVGQSLQPADPGHWTVSHYTKALSDGYFYRVLWQTLALAFVVTLICLVTGYPFAYAMVRTDGRARAVLMIALVAPLLVNVVVRSYGWMVLIGGGGVFDAIAKRLGFEGFQLLYTWTGVTIALVHVLLPLMVISLASQLETLDQSIPQAAATLGASPFKTFWFVTFPLTVEGVITGSIITFTMTLGSFVTVMLIGDNSTMILPLLIYQQLTVTMDWSASATLGIMLLICVAALLWLQAFARQWFAARATLRRSVV